MTPRTRTAIQELLVAIASFEKDRTRLSPETFALWSTVLMRVTELRKELDREDQND